MRPRPIPNCYWLPDGRILAGEYPGSIQGAAAAAKLRLLRAAGVDTFIDLTEDGELEPYESVLQTLADGERGVCAYYRLSVRDMRIPSPEHMHRVLDLIEAEQARGRTLYVHCWGGVGRTGTVIGCYLVRQGLTGKEALDRIAELWECMEKRHWTPRSPETDEQRAFVLGWAEHERARNRQDQKNG